MISTFNWESPIKNLVYILCYALISSFLMWCSINFIFYVVETLGMPLYAQVYPMYFVFTLLLFGIERYNNSREVLHWHRILVIVVVTFIGMNFLEIFVLYDKVPLLVFLSILIFQIGLLYYMCVKWWKRFPLWSEKIIMALLILFCISNILCTPYTIYYLYNYIFFGV